ncbi:universal stress protein [Reichenbachiella ulvae]|uniref:Universal stress protein n=1 Tax=Reichenbachiella ulvae TaxID=2980104 RepID=A0ABT3CP56_9BACT|nr:universal stress protein [Reichenbachiella ulvae]MCV9385351.1 universal stress protein [Reichenbachiella ulvae]
MNIIQNILIPVDFSEVALGAVKYVLGMARGDRKVNFTLLHIAEAGSDLAEADLRLKQLKEEWFDPEDFTCQTLVKEGVLMNSVADLVTEEKIDLVVMGTAGSQDESVNTHTAQLIELIDCPVWVIPNPAADFKLNNIALALDENELDNASDLRVFHEIARWYNAKVHLLKVDPEDKERKKVALKKEETLEYYLDSLEYHYSFPKNSDIEEGINQYISNNDIDALAIIPRIHAQNSQPSKGKLTKALASHSKVPLLVID